MGDVTITSYRSRFVDFTVPYTEPGLAMLVPTTDQEIRDEEWLDIHELELGAIAHVQNSQSW